MKNRFLVLMLLSLCFLGACRQEQKTAPDFSKVTKNLPKVEELKSSSTSGTSKSTSKSSSSKKKSKTKSASKASSKKEEDSEKTTDSQTQTEISENISPNKTPSSSRISESDEEKLRKTIIDLERQGLTWEEIYLKLLEDSANEWARIVQESSEELSRIVEETTNSFYNSADTTYWDEEIPIYGRGGACYEGYTCYDDYPSSNEGDENSWTEVDWGAETFSYEPTYEEPIIYNSED